MSEVRKLSASRVTDNPEGLTLLATDGSGNLVRLSGAGVAAMAVNGGSVMWRETLSPQDLNANTLNRAMTVYTPSGDMGTSWKGFAFENFPTAKPRGGFMLMCLPEGSYKRQVYTSYSSRLIFTRHTYYEGSLWKTTWSSWRRIDPSEA